MPRRPTLRCAGRTGLLMIAILWACRDSTAPAPQDDGTQYFRLVGMSGPGLIVPNPIPRGDLVLRPVGTFAWGFAGTSALAGGRWTLSGSDLRLAIDSGNTQTTALAGDTVTLSVANAIPGTVDSYFYTLFKFARRPYPGTTGLEGTVWVLRSINGAAATSAGLRAYSTTFQDITDVRYIQYDTISFQNRVFYRQSRAVADSVYFASTPTPQFASSGYSLPGGYDAGSARVVLGTYGPTNDRPAYDTLAVAGGMLVHRYHVGSPSQPVEERYERIR